MRTRGLAGRIEHPHLMHIISQSAIIIGVMISALACAAPTPTVPPSPTLTPVAAKPSATATKIPTATPPLPTETPVPTATTTSTLPPTRTPLPTATPTVTPTPYIPPAHKIAVRQSDAGAEFFNVETGELFIPRGVNYVYVPHNGGTSNLTLKIGVYDPDRTRRDFRALAERGFNTVRVFLDQCNAGPGCIGDSDNRGLNPAYVDNIADVLAAAQETGVFILFTSNDLPDQGGYAEQANAASGATFAGYRNSYYLTPGAVTATRRYWRDILTGLNDRAAATDRVLGWELLNEQWMFADQPPLSRTSGQVKSTTGTYDMADPTPKRHMVSDGLIHYVAEMKDEILAHDPTALVTMGFFPPKVVAPDWFVDTEPLLAGANLDFFDFHPYPGGMTVAQLGDVFGMTGYTAKPIIMGEYGAFRHTYSSISAAARALVNWRADSCATGFDGWLYWAYYPADISAGDPTWGFTDENGYLLDLLSPQNSPNPCATVAIPNDNLAFQKPVRASVSLPDEPPENAVDENGDTQWGAGADAPQWIEVDLGQPVQLTQVKLLVAQWPAGHTVHRLLGIKSDGSALELVIFDSETKQGDWLTFSPAGPTEAMQIIRVETVSSPSWIAWAEIQVLGESSP